MTERNRAPHRRRPTTPQPELQELQSGDVDATHDSDKALPQSEPANDNAETSHSVRITNKQARELQRMRALAEELLSLATRLEEDLFTDEVKQRIRQTRVPPAATVARVAEMMRKRGL